MFPAYCSRLVFCRGADKDNSNNQTFINWLKTHLKENKDAYLPKQELYETYR